MAEIKELYNLNQKTSAEKHACLNKWKEGIAQSDIDIAKFLGASDPVQVFIIRVLVDKHREVCKNLYEKKNITKEESFLVNQNGKLHKGSMQNGLHSDKEKTQVTVTRMELKPPTTQLVSQETFMKRKNIAV